LSEIDFDAAKCQSFNASELIRCNLLQGASMPRELTWDNADDIGILLSEAHPEIDPLSVRFTDLHLYVTQLPTFKDDPAKSSEGKLEAIQMAWHAEFLDRTQG
jgi:FeS assembly protein IscX